MKTQQKFVLALALASVFALPLTSARAEGDEDKKPDSSQLIVEGDEDKKSESSQLIAEGDEDKKPESSQLIV